MNSRDELDNFVSERIQRWKTIASTRLRGKYTVTLDKRLLVWGCHIGLFRDPVQTFAVNHYITKVCCTAVGDDELYERATRDVLCLTVGDRPQLTLPCGFVLGRERLSGIVRGVGPRTTEVQCMLSKDGVQEPVAGSAVLHPHDGFELLYPIVIPWRQHFQIMYTAEEKTRDYLLQHETQYIRVTLDFVLGLVDSYMEGRDDEVE